MLSFRVDGVVIAPVSDRSRPHLRSLTKNGVPFVLIDRSVPGDGIDLVQGDSVMGARRLVEHLLGLGHTRVAMVTEVLEVSTSRDRLDGYRQALEAAGLAYRDDFVVVGPTATDPRSGYDGLLRLLELPEPPTAIVAVNNVVAVGIVEAARHRGLEIPSQLALVCFDDIEYASRVSPFLTVMAQPGETFGTLAMQLLLDRITGRVPERARSVVLPADFIVRASCGAAER
jgi:LacI family transcriptional regulator